MAPFFFAEKHPPAALLLLFRKRSRQVAWLTCKRVRSRFVAYQPFSGCACGAGASKPFGFSKTDKFFKTCLFFYMFFIKTIAKNFLICYIKYATLLIIMSCYIILYIFHSMKVRYGKSVLSDKLRGVITGYIRV